MDYRTAPVYRSLIYYSSSVLWRKMVAVASPYQAFVPCQSRILALRYSSSSSAASSPPPHKVLPCHRGFPVINGMMWWCSSGVPAMQRCCYGTRCRASKAPCCPPVALLITWIGNSTGCIVGYPPDERHRHPLRHGGALWCTSGQARTMYSNTTRRIFSFLISTSVFSRCCRCIS